ncbi:MAG: hypothetical protein H0X73_15450 [Chthoniobacterales bacterium]|nr:hypothetical protein [Chthoniobacterales bacterium]
MKPEASSKLAIILASVALALAIAAIVARLLKGRGVDYLHVAFLLGLVAFVISLARRKSS